MTNLLGCSLGKFLLVLTPPPYPCHLNPLIQLPCIGSGVWGTFRATFEEVTTQKGRRLFGCSLRHVLVLTPICRIHEALLPLERSCPYDNRLRSLSTVKLPEVCPSGSTMPIAKKT